MKDTWSLDILYKGYDDTFQKDIKAFEKSVKQCDELAASLSHDNEKETLVNILKTMEEEIRLPQHKTKCLLQRF